MMAETTQPRANAAMLPALEGRGVTLLGQVAEAGAGAAFVVTSADRKPVSVSMHAGTQSDSPVAAGHWVDITGVVQHGKVVAVRAARVRAFARARALEARQRGGAEPTDSWAGAGRGARPAAEGDR
jgi:hypothetical protein